MRETFYFIHCVRNYRSRISTDLGNSIVFTFHALYMDFFFVFHFALLSHKTNRLCLHVNVQCVFDDFAHNAQTSSVITTEKGPLTVLTIYVVYVYDSV